MKRPAFQFYPADWRKDSALQSCSLAARGLWIEMVCVMHECEQYGTLSVNGNAMTEQQVARLVGESPNTIKRLVGELEAAGVFSKTEAGAIYSRRMVKDERVRNARAAGGVLGGNPDLRNKVNLEEEGKVNHSDNLKPTPSSSSSASRASDLRSVVASEPLGDCPHTAIIAAYHELLPTLPRVRDWTPQRQALLRNAWKRDRARQTLAWWRDLFAYVAQSDFLTGKVDRGDSAPFEADLEWIVRPKNLPKIIEGKYENRRRA